VRVSNRRPQKGHQGYVGVASVDVPADLVASAACRNGDDGRHPHKVYMEIHEAKSKTATCKVEIATQKVRRDRPTLTLTYWLEAGVGGGVRFFYRRGGANVQDAPEPH